MNDVATAEMLMVEAEHLAVRIGLLCAAAPPDPDLTAAMLCAAKSRDRIGRWLAKK